jgi:thiamine biosynthesis lipoprotein
MPDFRTPSLDRREMLTLGVGVFVAASLPWAARAPRRIHRRRVPVMGTIAEIAIVHAADDRTDRDRVRGASAAAFAALRHTERLMSRFLADSDVGRANRGAQREPVRIAAETAEVIRQALHCARTTAGRFDPCLGQVSELWDVGHRTVPPARARVAPLAGLGLWQALELDLDARGGAVRFRDASLALDLGGIAKGYGVDRAVAALRSHGIEDALVNVGGDLFALGHSADGDAWRVGVRDARDPRRIARTLAVCDQAVATSGDYRRYFDHGGRRYHHLLDPQTAAPIQADRHSATVVEATCMDADAAATAAFAGA